MRPTTPVRATTPDPHPSKVLARKKTKVISLKDVRANQFCSSAPLELKTIEGEEDSLSLGQFIYRRPASWRQTAPSWAWAAQHVPTPLPPPPAKRESEVEPPIGDDTKYSLFGCCFPARPQAKGEVAPLPPADPGSPTMWRSS